MLKKEGKRTRKLYDEVEDGMGTGDVRAVPFLHSSIKLIFGHTFYFGPKFQKSIGSIEMSILLNNIG